MVILRELVADLARSNRVDLSSWNWGAVPEWFAAVGTILAVIVALLVSRRDGKRYEKELEDSKADRLAAAEDRKEATADRRRQREERDELAYERKREHAQYVTLNVGMKRAEVRLPEEFSDYEEFESQLVECRALVTNHGTAPIYEARAEFADLEGAEIFGASTWWAARTKITTPIVRPGATVTYEARVPFKHLTEFTGQAKLVFRDTRGQWWQTDQKGRLTSACPDEGDDARAGRVP